MILRMAKGAAVLKQGNERCNYNDIELTAFIWFWL